MTLAVTLAVPEPADRVKANDPEVVALLGIVRLVGFVVPPAPVMATVIALPVLATALPNASTRTTCAVNTPLFPTAGTEHDRFPIEPVHVGVTGVTGDPPLGSVVVAIHWIPAAAPAVIVNDVLVAVMGPVAVAVSV